MSGRIRRRVCSEPAFPQGDREAPARTDSESASTRRVSFVEGLPRKGKRYLDRAVWAALIDLEKIRWPSVQEHVSLEKKILRSERWLTESLPQGAPPKAEKESYNTTQLYSEVQVSSATI